MTHREPTSAPSDPAAFMVAGLPGFAWDCEEKLCRRCNGPTTWTEVDLDIPVHPGTCSQEEWDERQWGAALALLREYGLGLKGVR